MPVGLQIFDASGNVIFDTFTVTYHVFGEVYIENDGSLTDARFAMGSGWYFFRQAGNLFGAPNISLSGNTLSWSRGNFAYKGYLMYGIR